MLVVKKNQKKVTNTPFEKSKCAMRNKKWRKK